MPLDQSFLFFTSVSVILVIYICILHYRIKKYNANNLHSKEMLYTANRDIDIYKKDLKESHQKITNSILKDVRQESELVGLKNEITFFKDQYEALLSDLKALNLKLADKDLETAELKVKVSLQYSKLTEHEEIRGRYFTEMQKSKEELQMQFKDIASTILEKSERKIATSNAETLIKVLDPFKERIHSFEKKVEESYQKEARERFSLGKEIERLQKLNQRISNEAINLTQALKGQKTQGDWGELILERVLEHAGLEKGREYQTQVSLKAENGERFQPDVLIMLPDKKQVVVDSKVSLIAYQRFIISDSETERKKSLKQHVLSIRNHIKDLSGKDYKRLEGIYSLDLVLLFIPIESAFSAAIHAEPNIFQEAFSSNIVIVSPTTLLATLRVVSSLWKQERQTQNAREIAERAGWLYDKFVLFIQDLDDIGGRLQQLDKSYSAARNKLITGRGNLVSRSEQLKVLGARTSKNLPNELLESAMTE